jgi:hypothetical protein
MARLKLLLTVNSLVGIIFGAVLLATPGLLMQMYGLPGGLSADLFARLFGAELLGLNLATWFVRDRPEGEGAQFAVLGHCVSETFGFAVSIGAALAHVGNGMVWSVVALFAIFAAANWYYYMGGVRLR